MRGEGFWAQAAWLWANASCPCGSGAFHLGVSLLHAFPKIEGPPAKNGFLLAVLLKHHLSDSSEFGLDDGNKSRKRMVHYVTQRRRR